MSYPYDDSTGEFVRTIDYQRLPPDFVELLEDVPCQYYDGNDHSFNHVRSVSLVIMTLSRLPPCGGERLQIQSTPIQSKRWPCKFTNASTPSIIASWYRNLDQWCRTDMCWTWRLGHGWLLEGWADHSGKLPLLLYISDWCRSSRSKQSPALCAWIHLPKLHA